MPLLPSDRPISYTPGQGRKPQLLYLVRYLDLLKFGHGDSRRVRAHLRAGCTPVLVVQADHHHVVAAELTLKRALKEHLVDPVEWHMPVTFGAGSEVVPDHVEVDLYRALGGTVPVQDVTSHFA